MTRTLRRRRALRRLSPCRAVILATVVFVAACAPAADPSPRAGRAKLQVLPRPDLSARPVDVRRLVEGERAALERLLESAAEDGSAVRLAQAFGRVGTLYLAAGIPEAAEAAFRNAVILEPRQVSWLSWLGLVYRKEGRLDAERDALRRVLDLKPDDVIATLLLADLHLRESDLGNATRLFARAVALEAARPAAHAGLGRIAALRGDYDEAIDHFETALRLDPRQSGLHYRLAMAYRERGDEDSARAHLEQQTKGSALSLDPSDVLDPLDAELSRIFPDPSRLAKSGLAALAAGLSAEAIATLRRAVRTAPESPEMHLNLGVALARSGAIEAATASFQAALELDPDNAPACLNLGAMASDRGEHHEALRFFRRAVSADPGLAAARMALADALQRTGDYAAAMPQFEEAARLVPSAVPARLGQAMALIRLERYESARGVLERAVATFPRHSELRHALARLLATAPDSNVRDGARSLELAEAVFARHRSVESGTTVAMALAELGRFDEALGWQEQALRAANARAEAELITSMMRHLELYRRGLPCREFWSGGTVP